jgi:alanine racemase
MSCGRPTTAQLDLENLRYNFNSAKRFIGDQLSYMAVVKADAYGHGAVQCSRALSSVGCDWLAVATVEEAVELREGGIRLPILILGGFYSGQAAELLRYDICPVIYTIEAAHELHETAIGAGQTARCHVKIDTGMGRIGVRPEQAGDFADALVRLPGLEVEAMMTHFAAADDLNEAKFTQTQINTFYEVVKVFRSRGIEPKFIDLANSPGAIAHANARGGMVRLGGILYGLVDDVLPRDRPRPELKPVMCLTSAVVQLKEVPEGETIGYGRTFRTQRPSAIATIPIGYHDGYRRVLSNRARVLVNGEYAPVVGRISMDWTTIDVTGIPNVRHGSRVTLIGQDGEKLITAEELAGLADTISYEITCGISRRVPRIYSDQTPLAG